MSDKKDNTKYRYRSKSKGASEILGPYTSLLASAIIGGGLAGVGNLVTKNHDMPFAIGSGVLMGTAAGLAANIIGRIEGKYGDTRSQDDTLIYNQSGGDTAMNLLVPGAASYNRQQSKRRKYEDQVIDQYLAKHAAVIMPEEVPESPIRWGNNLAISGGVGLGAALMAYMYMHRRSQSSGDDDATIAKRERGRIGKAALLGLGAAAATLLLASASDMTRGTNYSHKYAKPGEDKKRVVFYFGGSGGGPHLNKDGVDFDHVNVLLKYDTSDNSDTDVYMFNAHDLPYAKKFMTELAAERPDLQFELLGHSHGATNALRLAEWAADNNIHINRLDTLDPIMTFGLPTGKPATTDIWNNYRLTHYDNSGTGNFWAKVGGTPGALEGAIDHVFDPEITGYRDHTEARFFPLDRNDGTVYQYNMPPEYRQLIDQVYQSAAAKAQQNNK